MKIKNWKRGVLDRDSWRTIVERTKTRRVVASIKKKKCKHLQHVSVPGCHLQEEQMPVLKTNCFFLITGFQSQMVFKTGICSY